MAQKELPKIPLEKWKRRIIADYFLPSKVTTRQMQRAEELMAQGEKSLGAALSMAEKEYPAEETDTWVEVEEEI